jgi:hypothetical protein
VKLKTYSITVREIHETLGKMIDDGFGDAPFVVLAGFAGGKSIQPLCSMGVGGIVLRGDIATIDESEMADTPQDVRTDGTECAYVETPAMVPCGFWAREINAPQDKSKVDT